jgi:CHAT domain-containing protein
LRRAARLFELEKNDVGRANVQLRLSALESSIGNNDAALALAKRTASTFEKRDNTRLRLSAMWLEGDLLRKLNRLEESKRLIDKTLKLARSAEQPAIVHACLNSLGLLSRELGDTNRAVKYFETAIDAVEAARDPLPGEEFRMAFLAKSLEPFENLSRLYTDLGKIENAFVTIERGRSRALLDAVTNGTRRTSSDASGELREELNWLYSRLARAEDDEIERIQKQIRAREKDLAAQSLRQQSASRARVAKRSTGLDLKTLQARLGSSQALIEFVERDGWYSAFVVTSDRIEYVAKLISEAEVRSHLEGLHFQFGALRFGESMRAFAGELKRRADIYLRDLHERLLKPLSATLADRDLVIVPARSLNYVPFHALFDGERYELETREITFTPSAAVWLELSHRRPRRIATALLMSFADERIPLVDREVKSIAKLLPQATKLTGRASTFSAFQHNATNADLVHLACHGQFRPDNPMFSSLHLADGWVTVRDVCSTRLKAELVTLSACETGMSHVYSGDEILGLARGFLSAGARSLVLSLWTVNDAVTSRLMLDFYNSLQRGSSVAASLRVAQLNLIKQGEHPYFWSPFFVIA